MRIDWVDDAVCRGHTGFHNLTIPTQKLACRTCPVRRECLVDELEYANHANPSTVHFVRGGFTSMERLRAVRDADGDLGVAFRVLTTAGRGRRVVA